MIFIIQRCPLLQPASLDNHDDAGMKILEEWYQTK